MSESDATLPDIKSEAEFVRQEREATLPYDPELVRLVNFINALDTAEIGVTLHIKGCVISGMLISVSQFYRILMKDFVDPSRLGKASDINAAKAFVEFFRPSLVNAEKLLRDYRDSEDFTLPSPRHIHMRYAQTLDGPGQPFTQTVWRGRLAEVDGWSTGNFGSIPPLAEADT